MFEGAHATRKLLATLRSAWAQTHAERSVAAERIRQVTRLFFGKARQLLGKVPFMPDAVAMYFAMLDARTPFHVKATVAVALLYLITPFDIIPDVLPVAGYTDDAAVLWWTLTRVRSHIRPEHHEQAQQWLTAAGHPPSPLTDA